jgi:hypothetical protein
MKKLFFAISCLILTFQAYSQEKLTLGLSAGLSKPMGDFASTEMDTSADGFTTGLAKPGLSVDFTGNYKINKNFGLMCLVRYQSNALDEDAMLGLMSDAISSGVSVTIDSKPWKTYSFMGGVNHSFPLMDKLSLESRVLVGASMVKSPDFDLGASIFGFTFTSNTKGESQTSFSTLFGTGVKYKITDKIGVTANVDYWMTSTKTKSTTTDSSGESSTDVSTDPLKMSTLNLNLGIAYKLF